MYTPIRLYSAWGIVVLYSDLFIYLCCMNTILCERTQVWRPLPISSSTLYLPSTPVTTLTGCFSNAYFVGHWSMRSMFTKLPPLLGENQQNMYIKKKVHQFNNTSSADTPQQQCRQSSLHIISTAVSNRQGLQCHIVHFTITSVIHIKTYIHKRGEQEKGIGCCVHW